MASEELALLRIATEAYTNISVLHQHYVETISKLTGKEKSVIEDELKKILPEQKKKTEEFIKEIVELYIPKADVL